MSSTLLSPYIVQAVGALFTAVLFGVFSRTYRKPFLVHWARAWSAMCIMLAGAALTTLLRNVPPIGDPRHHLGGHLGRRVRPDRLIGPRHR